MTQGVSADEMAGAIAQLRSQPTTMSGITLLDQHYGDLEEALEESLVIEYGGAMMGNRSLRETTLTVVRKELCGDEGFRGLVKGYSTTSKSHDLISIVRTVFSGVAGRLPTVIEC